MAKKGATRFAELKFDISENDLLAFEMAEAQYDGQVDRAQCHIERIEYIP